jgi:hypothetical protein
MIDKMIDMDLRLDRTSLPDTCHRNRTPVSIINKIILETCTLILRLLQKLHMLRIQLTRNNSRLATRPTIRRNGVPLAQLHSNILMMHPEATAIAKQI